MTQPHSASPKAQSTRRSRRILLSALAAWMLFTYVPLTRTMGKGPVYTRLPDREWAVRHSDFRLWPGLRWEWSGGQTSSEPATAVASHAPIPPAPCERIWIVCRTEGTVALEFAKALAEELLGRDGIEEVALFPYRQLPIEEYRSPDLWVVVEQWESDSLTLPGFFRAEGVLDIRIGTHVAHLPAPYQPTGIWKSQPMAFKTSRFGLISAAGRWRPVAKAICQEMDFAQTLEQCTPRGAEPLPSPALRWMHGPQRSGTIGPIRALRGKHPVQEVTTGPIWLAHDHSFWILKPTGSEGRVAAELKAALIAEGWEQREATGHLHLGDRILFIRPLGRKGEEGPLTLKNGAHRGVGITHFHPFQPSECADFLIERLEQNMPVAEVQSVLTHLDDQRKEAMRRLLQTKLAAGNEFASSIQTLIQLTNE